MSKFRAPEGHESLALGFPWVNYVITALTRRYLVAPCWKNTRSAGLEVLKGRQIESTNNAELGSNVTKVAPRNCTVSFCATTDAKFIWHPVAPFSTSNPADWVFFQQGATR